MGRSKIRGGKRGQIGWNELVPWIISIGVLALTIILFISFSDYGKSLGETIKSWLRFR